MDVGFYHLLSGRLCYSVPVKHGKSCSKAPDSHVWVARAFRATAFETVRRTLKIHQELITV